MYFIKDAREYGYNFPPACPPLSKYQYTATAGPESGVFLGV